MAEAPGTVAFSPGSVLVRRADHQAGDSKLRPCVVVSSEARGVDPHADTVIVVPLSSDTDGRQRLAMPVIVPDTGNGLQHTSAAMAGRVSSVRKTRLVQRIGEVSASDCAASGGAWWP
ncbi:type II toxin-antitoxin system PemK/MazF family toxin [Cyanobium sp. FGCU-52]|nr:type II toxin-antitoxin system PemK/MazF family toxin [Cyanobium sp. FGCU52]